MLTFSNPVIQEDQLEPDDDAFYTFDITNGFKCPVTISEIVIALTYPVDTGLTGPPSVSAPAALDPGESQTVGIDVSTTGTPPGTLNITATPTYTLTLRPDAGAGASSLPVLVSND